MCWVFVALELSRTYIHFLYQQGSMSVADISEQLNLANIKDHGWHIQVRHKMSNSLLYINWTHGGLVYFNFISPHFHFCLFCRMDPDMLFLIIYLTPLAILCLKVFLLILYMCVLTCCSFVSALLCFNRRRVNI